MDAVAVVTGATLQRSTGLWFTLVFVPFPVLVLSPYEGVALANLLSLVDALSRGLSLGPTT